MVPRQRSIRFRSSHESKGPGPNEPATAARRSSAPSTVGGWRPFGGSTMSEVRRSGTGSVPKSRKTRVCISWPGTVSPLSIDSNRSADRRAKVAASSSLITALSPYSSGRAIGVAER